MNKHLFIFGTVLVVLLLEVRTPQFAQGSPTGPTNSDQVRRSVAIGLLRTINTAEVGELNKYGAYSSWTTLLAHQPKTFDEWFARFSTEDPKGHFGDIPEILPRWNLRLIVHADGKGYDVRLQDLTDK